MCLSVNQATDNGHATPFRLTIDGAGMHHLHTWPDDRETRFLSSLDSGFLRYKTKVRLGEEDIAPTTEITHIAHSGRSVADTRGSSR